MARMKTAESARHAAIFKAPAVIGGLRNADRLQRLAHGLAQRDQRIDLAKLLKYLIGGIFLRRRSVMSPSDPKTSKSRLKTSFSSRCWTPFYAFSLIPM